VSYSRADVVACALSFVGTPYHHQGRVPGVGFDCAALLIVPAWQLGIKPRSFDVRGYPPSADGSSLRAYCEEHMQHLAPGAEQPGDAGLFDWGRHPHHLGIFVPYRHGGLAIVHAFGRGNSGKVLESRYLPRMRLVAAYAFPGVS
jgi:cell wall-associated NlpC family hydrolase